MEKFKVIIVEDVLLELKGTEGLLHSEVPEAEIIATANSEDSFWEVFASSKPDLVLLDLGLGGNEQLWVDALHAHCDGIILKSGELLTRDDVLSVMNGKKYVFNQPILKKIVDKFCDTIQQQMDHQEALIRYEIDEYDERFLRHLALGYTKDQISQLRTMPFGVKSLEKRQNELVQRLFPNGNGGMGVNATRLVVKAFELNILDVNNLYSDEA